MGGAGTTVATMELSREGDASTLSLGGDLTLHTTASLFRELTDLVREGPTASLEVDLAAVGSCDTAGAALIVSASHRLSASPEAVRITGANEQVSSILALVEGAGHPPEQLATRHPSPGMINDVGAFVLEVADNARATLEYIGSLVYANAYALRHPSSVRWRDTLRYMAAAGANAFGIVALVNLLVGVIVAFQALEQLQDFGLELFVVEAVGISMTRELGPLMTAIIVAGRSGSGFAAEIGTMTVNEEVAALDTMGLDRTKFLVLPKVIALTAMMPLLVIFAGAVGILGGLLVANLAIELPVGTYLHRTAESLELWDLFQGLIKGQVYAIIVAAVGCLRGLQTRKGAMGVGVSTTSAVVTGLFLIIVADAILTVLYAQLG